MRLRLPLVLVFTVFSIVIFGQDVLYTISGSKLQSKVLEINSKDIKYKDFKNIDGPTYVIAKTDIVLIQYSNGITEIVNSNPTTIEPKVIENKVSETKAVTKVQDGNQPYVQTKKNPEKKPLNLYYLNNNMLSINMLALANGDITLMYDRDILNSRMSISFLGGYNFNSRMGGLNAFIYDAKESAKKKFDVGLGINFMPRNTKRVQYFVGLLTKYMAYDYREVVDTTNNQKVYKSASASQLAIMISNGWVFRVTPNFNFKFFGSIGAGINSTPLTNNIQSTPKVYLGYCFGYRF